MNLHRAANILVWLGLLIHVGFVAFHVDGIVVGGDCRPVRLVALFTAGLMGIMMALLVRWREQGRRHG